MREIDESVIQATCAEIERLKPSRIPVEMARASREQPELVGFIMGSTEGMAPGVGELAGFIFFVIWRAFRRETKGALPPITSDAIQEALDRNERELARLDDLDPALVETVTFHQLTSQPALFRYMLETIAGAEEEPDQPLTIPPEDKAGVMILLITAIDVLDQARKAAHGQRGSPS